MLNRNAYISNHGQLSSEILLNIAEILTLRLPEGSERITAAKWVKKFLACDPADYKHNLSLFISCLTKQMLVEPFNVPPQDMTDQWQNFQREYTTTDINKAVSETLWKDAMAPPYLVEISQDLHEYVAFQEIPLFGAHFYFAFSPSEPINHWQNFSALKVPRKQVEKLLQLEASQIEAEESPIKGRISRKPRDRARGPTKLTSMPKPKAKPKKQLPKWEGAVEKEEEEPEPEPEPTKKPMIVIPTDGPIKAIPPALQRKMAEAERQRQERLANLQKDRQEQVDRATPNAGKSKKARVGTTAAPRKSIGPDSISPGPSTSSKKTPKVGSQVSLRQKILTKAAVRGENLIDELSSAEESPDPVYYGPDNMKDFYKKKLAGMRNVPDQVPEQIITTSAALSNELQRTQRERTANAVVVNAIQDQEINIGERLVNALSSGGTAKSVATDSLMILDELKDLMFDVSVINKSAGPSKPIVAPETLKRLNAIKNKAQEISEVQIDYLDPREISRRTEIMKEIEGDENLEDIDVDFGNISGEQSSLMNVMAELQRRDICPRFADTAENALDLVNETVNKSQEAIDALSKLEPKTASDQEIIEQLIESNNDLINEVAANVQPLIEAIESNDPNLLIIVQETVAELQQAINVSNTNDSIAADVAQKTQVSLEAAEVQDERNESLEKVLEKSEEIAQQVQQSIVDFGGENEYVSKDPAVRRYMGHDDEADLIDVTDINTDFEGGVVDPEEFLEQVKKTRKEKMLKYRTRTSSIFASIDNDENLDEINNDFNDLLDESIEALEEVLVNLDEAQDKSNSREEQENIEEMKEKTQEKIEKLEEIRENRADNLQQDQEQAAVFSRVQQIRSQIEKNVKKTMF